MNQSPAYFAHVNSRSNRMPFGIKYVDRMGHVYVIGKTGVGKTTLLESLVRQDIDRGFGVTLIDPHGDFVERVYKNLPNERRDECIYFDLANPNQPYGYNPLKYITKDKRPLAASGLLEVLKKTWKDSWGQRLEHILRNAILALLDSPNSTLLDILRLLDDKAFRQSVITRIADERVREYWESEYANYSYRLRADAIVPIQNKVGAFLSDPVLRRVLTQPQQPLSLRQIMDNQQILLVNLAKGRFGEDSSNLMGGFLVTTLGLAAFSRADSEEASRIPHYVFVDEFQNFTTLAIANMVSELRKYKIALVMANQYLSQIELEIRDAILGNAGTLISFRLSAKDAVYVSKELAPRFLPEDLVHLPNYEIYLKLMIDGAPSKPFSAKTLSTKEALMYNRHYSRLYQKGFRRNPRQT